jgi:hypothetical protein
MKPGSSILLVASIVFAVQAPASAQIIGTATSEDSAGVRIAALRVVLDTLGPQGADAGRIWVRPHTERDPATGERRSVTLSPAERAAVAEAFPTARVIDAPDTSFLCPPMMRTLLPGTGCPIRDDGVIVEFAPLRFDGDSVSTAGMLIQSWPAARGTLTWVQWIDLVLDRTRGKWEVRGIRGRWLM